MAQITQDEARHWLEAYGRAWEKGDPEAVTPLFTEDARYIETPFAPPMEGRAAIHAYWTEGAATAQQDVRFTATPWSLTPWPEAGEEGAQCLAHWRAAFRRVPSGEAVEIDGVFRLRLLRTPGGVLCAQLQEWWHRR